MCIDAIIFDKDGTLLDFEAFWIPVSVKAIKDALKELGAVETFVEPILEAFGVYNGIADINGVLCKGTYQQMGQIVYDILTQAGYQIPPEVAIKAVIEAYNNNDTAGEIKPTTPELVRILTQLKRQNKKLAVVTTDNRQITCKCLEELGIYHLFDKVYTDDGQIPTKPDPYCVSDFCRLTGIPKEHILMVGDTVTDIRFAKNAGISVVGVAKTEQNKQILAEGADAVIPDLSHIFELLEERSAYDHRNFRRHRMGP